MNSNFVMAMVLLGIMISFFGWIIKSQESIDMLNGFNDRTYDKKKMSKVLGTNLLYVGVLLLLISLSHFIITNNSIDFLSIYSTEIIFIEKTLLVLIALKIIIEINSCKISSK